MHPAEQIGAVRGDRRDPSVSDLLGGIITDVQTLVRKEIALQAREIQQRIDSAAARLAALVALGSVVALGGGLVALGLALAVAHVVGWPAWGGLLAVGGVMALGGAIWLVGYRRTHRRDVQEWHRTRTSFDTR